MKRLIFAIAILPGLLIACTTVTFREPQPVGGIALKEFPDSLQGHYYNYDTQNELCISKQIITLSTLSNDTISIKSIAANEKVKGDSLCHTITKQAYKIQKISDSLISGYKYVDTIFSLKNTDIVLKSYGRDYFLNINSGDDWEVNKLAVRGDVINIAGIKTQNEIKMMESITQTNIDSSGTISFKPSKEQFQKFLEQNGFIEGQTYLRVRPANKIL